MKKNVTLIAVLLLLSSCNNRAAKNPWSYAPACYDNPWTPSPSQKEAIPRCLLMETADSCCEQNEECAEEDAYSLAELIDTALIRSPQTKETWSIARIAAAEYGLGQSPYYPEIDFNAFFLATRDPGFFGSRFLFIDEFREYAPYISLNYLVLDFGTTRAKSRALYQRLMAANWIHNDEIQKVIQNVSLDYYSYITDRDKVAAGEANLHDAETTLGATEAKHGRGIVSITDVLTAKTTVSKQTIELLNDEQSVADSLAKLLAEAGLPANACVGVANIIDEIDVDEFLDSVDHFLCLAYDLRPDLHAAYARVLSDESSVKAAQRDQLPQVSLSATTGQYYFNSGRLNDYGYNAQLSLNFPLFRGWYYANQIREAKARLELSQAQLRDVELQMVRQVVTSYQDFNFATEKVRVNKEFVALAEETFEANLAEYKTGTVDITTLVNSQTNLANARYSLAEARKQWYDALTNLTYASGLAQKGTR